MISELSIKNFQSHKQSNFNFSEGVNVIVATSDSGKSSVFRSLRLVFQNRPLGLSFHSTFAKKEELTEVTLTVQDKETSHKISRNRSETENSYVADGIVYSAFGSDVPDKISEMLNISDINCQFQMDSPFLFSDTPGAVARYLNKIVNLDKIDIALQNISSKKRQNESEIKFQQSRLDELDISINKFPDLESVDKRIFVLESLNEEIDNYIYSKDILSETISSTEEIESKIQIAQTVSKYSIRVQRLEKILIVKQKLEQKYDALYKVVKSIENIEKYISAYQKILCREPELSKLEELLEELNGFKYTRDVLFKMISDIEGCEAKSEIKLAFIETESLRLKKLMGNQCPLCGSKI